MKNQIKFITLAAIIVIAAAVTYNEYFLKNRYVFKNNIPEDLREELEILK